MYIYMQQAVVAARGDSGDGDWWRNTRERSFLVYLHSTLHKRYSEVELQTEHVGQAQSTQKKTRAEARGTWQ